MLLKPLLPPSITYITVPRMMTVTNTADRKMLILYMLAFSDLISHMASVLNLTSFRIRNTRNNRSTRTTNKY